MKIGMRFFMAAIVAGAVFSNAARAAALAEPAGPLTPTQVRAAMRRGIEFLLKDQNPDGSWGGAGQAVYTFTGDVWSNPETHHSWRVATTGLCCLALLENDDSPAARAAVDRSLDYLLQNAAVKRPSEWDTMHVWAYMYGLQALAAIQGHPRYANSPKRAEIRKVGDHWIHKLAECQSPNGGWGYLEFDVPRTPNLQWATSFTTAAGVVALAEAKRQGFEVDAGLLQRAVGAIRRCRLPSGAYTYSVPVIADPRGLEWIDNIKGSLSRIQVCNEALLMAGQDVPAERLQTGIAYFFQHHRFLDIASNKPIPHENYYYNSGYFYLFGHYYAARIIERLPAEERAKRWPQLQYEIIKMQQPDGSIWDYDMHRYHKPYGVAFGVLTLGRSLRETESVPQPAAAPAVKAGS